jgi:hypothetical protein
MVLHQIVSEECIARILAREGHETDVFL